MNSSTASATHGGRPDAPLALLAFGVMTMLWLAFGAALVADQGSLDNAWGWLQGLPVFAQAAVWILFLPVTAGLWVWETTWPVALRLIAIGGLAFATLYAFFPRFLFSRSE